jgi:hypothetical protein
MTKSFISYERSNPPVTHFCFASVTLLASSRRRNCLSRVAARSMLRGTAEFAPKQIPPSSFVILGGISWERKGKL